MIVVVRLPDLPMRDFGELEPRQLEGYRRSHVDRLGTERLAIDDILVVDVCRWRGLDCS